jgi:predicted nucleic acid-binding protein
MLGLFRRTPKLAAPSLALARELTREVEVAGELRVGQAAAVRIGERLMQTRWCRIVEVSEDMRDAAWQLFVRYHDHVFSFTDCTSFALMRAMSLEEAFTFDRGDFAPAGLATLV